jgi:colanic acid/amylovoran biosynthesis glycosyltransferase
MTTDATSRVAVFVPVLGAPSETFIRRHVEDLLPGRTLVVARRTAPPDAPRWTVDVPTLLLDPLTDEWGGAREQEAVSAFLQAHGVSAVLLEFLDIWVPFTSTFQSLGVRCVAHAHGYDVSQRLRDAYWRSAYLTAYRDAHAVVAMSDVAKDRLVDLGLESDQVAVVPYGVDLVPPIDREARSPVHVLAVGRLVPKKDPLATVAACDQAARRGADLRVSVVGEGPLMAELQAAAATAVARIDLLGVRPHAAVLSLMRSADIFCQHSVVDPVTGDEEGVPVAILEAMAHGLPVVSTRHAGIPEAVSDGVTGLLVDEGDVESMAAHVYALSSDLTLRKRLGSAGRERARERFTWERERRHLLRLLAMDDEPMRITAGTLI